MPKDEKNVGKPVNATLAVYRAHRAVKRKRQAAKDAHAAAGIIAAVAAQQPPVITAQHPPAITAQQPPANGGEKK